MEWNGEKQRSAPVCSLGHDRISHVGAKDCVYLGYLFVLKEYDNCGEIIFLAFEPLTFLQENRSMALPCKDFE